MKNKKRYYIKPIQATGRKIPVVGFIVLWLLMDRLKAPEWLYGIYWFLAGMCFLTFVWDMISYDEKPVDIKKFLENEYNIQEAEKKEH